MINYDEIIDNLDDDKIIRLLQNLGADDIIDKNDYIIFPTICHNETEGSMKLYYYKNTHLFYCYTNCGGMNIFSLLKHYYETRGVKYEWKKDIWDVVLKCSSPITLNKEDDIRIDKEKYQKRFQEVVLPIYDSSILNIYTEFYPPEWLNENITIEAMKRFHILYSISENKIIIPHFNCKNELVGIRGRALNNDEITKYGKYMPVYANKHLYAHPLSFNLYGLNNTHNLIQKYGYCIFFEGEKSVLKMESFNMPNCSVATCGSTLNKYQIELILHTCHPKEIILAYDNEEEENKDDYFNKLYKLCSKYTNFINMSFVYDRNKLTKQKDAPVDAGEEIFNELLRTRVRLY